MVQDFETAYKLFPKINADICLADLHRSKGNFAEAKKWLDLYGTRVDQESDIFYNRLCADINAGLGNKEEAMRRYLMLVDKDSGNAIYYTARINSLL